MNKPMSTKDTKRKTGMDGFFRAFRVFRGLNFGVK